MIRINLLPGDESGFDQEALDALALETMCEEMTVLEDELAAALERIKELEAEVKALEEDLQRANEILNM